MKRRRVGAELLLLICVLAGWAAVRSRSENPAARDDLSYQQQRRELLAAWRAGHMHECDALCQRLLDQDRRDLLALRYRGLLWLRLGDKKQARKWFDLGCKQDPSYFWGMPSEARGCLLRDRARLNLADKRWAAALADAKEAQSTLMWGDDYLLASDTLACAQFGAGNVTEARAVYSNGGEAEDPEVALLIGLHRARAEGTVPPAPAKTEPVWHPAECPLCR